MTDDTGGRIWVNAVHYDKPTLAEVQQYFESLGFEGIQDLRKSDAVNCNTARSNVVATEKRGGPKWYYQGNYDVNVGSPCRIYTFTCDVMPADRG